MSSASCSSSASRTSGQASARTSAIAAGIEAADFGEHRFGQHAAHFDGAGAALFERRVVEIGVGIRVQNFVRELRGHGRVHGEAADAARGHVAQARARRPSMSIASVSTSFITSRISG